jgi:hypothetical protein
VLANRAAQLWVALAQQRDGTADDRRGGARKRPEREAAAHDVVLGLLAVAAVAGFALDRAAQHQAAVRRGEQRTDAARHAAFLASLGRQERATVAHGPRDPGTSAPRGRRIAARETLLGAARARIRTDAAARTGKRIVAASCEPFPRTVGGVAPTHDLTRTAAAYSCTAVTSRFGSRATGDAGIIGYPFRLIARFARGSYAWCRVIPLGDADRLSHPLPRACRLP